MAKTIPLTGSAGHIGSEACVYFAARGYTVRGGDNNQRAVAFTPDARGWLRIGVLIT